MQVEYTIQHTAGVIQRVSLALETSDFNSTVTSISQEFAVTYTESNKTTQPTLSRSGNPGYIIGEF